MSKKKPLKKIFLSSIHQNAGKTTVALGLYKALREKKLRTGFIKPVGQEVVSVGDYNVDKDSYLIGEVYHMGRKLKEMSPITIGRGYTAKYIFHPQKDKHRESIEKSFQVLSRGKDVLIVEGTGHAGVGSVIDFSNADVASLLGSKTIIISEGGIGRTIDEVMLNKALFDLKGVETVGVIVNKVLPGKYDRIKRVVKKGLENKGLKLLGVIPLEPMLSAPTIEQVQGGLKAKVICGKKNLSRRVKGTVIAAMEPHNMINYLIDGSLVITSGDRVDNILLAVSSHLISSSRHQQVAGVILTGGLVPDAKILDLLKRSQMPVLVTEEDTYAVAGKIDQMICKIQKTDKDKIQEASRLVKKYVQVNEILSVFNGE